MIQTEQSLGLSSQVARPIFLIDRLRLADRSDHFMTNRFPVFNVSRDYYVRLKQAKRAIEECACAWVEYGVSVRDLTLAESIQARNRQAKLREPLEYAELPGLRFKVPAGSGLTAAESRVLVRAAHQFAEVA